ncbi:alpha/beta fold hydrolase [Microbacterium aerolatum]|uniref:alpha/beta hydrolase family protein n=1 Tax=Microbacterium aerolatum TaxID=153731 RepID=UPI0020018E39|nr:alpha/beta fold hydrolase [Microbacterium aerolatum]MCK3771117.1 alpha/beta fold hydrolase [Microbacterium aerolatum]
MTHSTEVSWLLDGIEMYGTVTAPDTPGPHPAVVMVAGSGPTDRDWTSPLIPGSNGSARLLAEAFADAGIVSMRYDKRASGPHVAENLPALIGRMSMQSHLDELVAAVGALAGRDDVDAERIVGLGNSEGCLHVLHYATSEQAVPFAGLVLIAPPGRSIGDVLLSQLGAQLGQMPGGADLMPLVEQAAARFTAGEPMNPDPQLPESVRMVLASFETPANLPFARELWAEDATVVLAEAASSGHPVPTLVVIGHKDVQVDAAADGGPLQQAVAGRAGVTFAFPANANHVLKEDVRTAEERAAARGAGYNEPGTRLDPEALAVVLEWLQNVLGLRA